MPTKALSAAVSVAGPAYISPWKLASTYALLSIAESLLTMQQPGPPRPDPAGAEGQRTGELPTVAEVAEMTRLSVGTLRWWRRVRDRLRAYRRW